MTEEFNCQDFYSWCVVSEKDVSTSEYVAVISVVCGKTNSSVVCGEANSSRLNQLHAEHFVRI